MEIIPGILEKEWSEIEKKIEVFKTFTQWVHIDLIDGKFADNTTFLDPEPFKKYSHEVNLELHMMVEDPEKYLDPFANAGFRRFIGHIEKMTDQVSFVARAQLWGEVGLALDTPTAIEEIKVSFEDLDFITVMTVKTGFSGQTFMPEMLEKVAALRSKTVLPIEIDGGVADNVLKQAKQKGVTRCAPTSFMFQGNSPKEQYELLKKASVENQSA